MDAFSTLAWEIKHLPYNQTRKDLETDFCWLWFMVDRLPEKEAIRHYRTLRAQVSEEEVKQALQARIQYAAGTLDGLTERLANLGGAHDWNRSEWAVRLADWTKGHEASGLAVEANFEEASDIAEELDKRIAALSTPKFAPRPTAPRHR